MFKIIGIVTSLILGVFLGRWACFILNKREIEAHPAICSIIGAVGGVLGSWLASSVGFGGGLKSMVLQIGVGVAFAVVLLLFLALLFPRNHDDFDDDDEEEEE